MRLRLQVPGSTSNLGSGFDCLGMALDLGMSLEVETAAPGTLTIDVGGAEAAGVPRDASNASAAALITTLRQRDRPIPGLHLRVDNAIPVGRGLGSSAAAIVAGVAAAHLLLEAESRRQGTSPERGETRSRHENPEKDGSPDLGAIARAAAAIEGHPDNVAPAVFGGLVASCQDSARLLATPFPLPAALELCLVVPALPIPTKAARKLLPQRVSRADAVFNLGRLALLLGGFVHDEPSAWRAGTEDRLHQRHRLALCPGLAAALQSLLDEPACLAAFLSGSGPTLIGFYRPVPANAGAGAVEILARHGVASRRQVTLPTSRGLVWELHQSA